ncbi:hypothetical protein [Nocardioides mangrovi]|uniref:Integral membrane protein n=1 Tax=Nocardioides mangrovi TaxID=2874580 RepID=A0ABS7UCH2_9ACTN|nr:hypothetical protein [Nocardioides mangrovi]MBZ5738698.1 hypothetical protein [Nocardioides mangrovi]
MGARVWITLVAGLTAIAAVAGAVAMALGTLGMPEEVEDRLPFGSPVAGAAALLLVVGVPNAVLALLARRGDPRTGRAAVAVGLVLVGWIVVQVLVIRELSPLQPTFVLVGVLLVWLGTRPARA